jgi:hypothetical protein
MSLPYAMWSEDRKSAKKADAVSWARSNPERRRAIRRRWYERRGRAAMYGVPERRAVLLARAAAWKRAHPERVNAAHKRYRAKRKES